MEVPIQQHMKKKKNNTKIFNKEVNDVDLRPCLHDQCTECDGTGKKKNGQTCIHYISCPCPKCTPTY